MKCLRPDCLVQSISTFASLVFKTDLAMESEYKLGQIVGDEIQPSTPVCLVSVPGYNASYRVENLIKTTGTCCVQVATGSQEGYLQADAAIALAVHQGSWVLLKNAHLAHCGSGGVPTELEP